MEYNTVEYMYDMDDDCLSINVKDKRYCKSIISNNGNYINISDSGTIIGIDIEHATMCFDISMDLFDYVDDIEVLGYAMTDDIMTIDITLKIMDKLYYVKDYIPCESGICSKSICYTMV